MKVTSVTYEQMRNTGNFEHASASVTVELEPGDTPYDAMERAKKFVAQQLGERIPEHQLANAKNILANPMAYTGYQVEEAKKISALCETQDELPF